MVCHATREDAQLVRAGRTPDGSWYLGRGSGRGAWWCASGACARSLSPGALARALRAPVTAAEVAVVRALADPRERR
ncbi:MAG: DUF448 domain-containing protein [Acidimicrobiales bacterium]